MSRRIARGTAEFPMHINEVETAEISKYDLELMLKVLRQEFPLMSSSRLPFRTAADVAEYFMAREEQRGEIRRVMEKYIEYLESGFNPELDPLKDRA